MRTHPNILANPAAGQRTEILRRADQLEDRIDLRVAIEHVAGGGGPPHVHPNQTEHFHVLHGSLRVILGDQELLLGRGAEATVPPGTVHTFSAAEDDTEFDVRVSPALRIEAALEDGYELFDRGSLGPEGPIDMPACQAYFERYADEIQLAPPGPAAS
jgi:mannose-6-phosphate isomerase-like protein (cupin superfamily)